MRQGWKLFQRLWPLTRGQGKLGKEVGGSEARGGAASQIHIEVVREGKKSVYGGGVLGTDVM